MLNQAANGSCALAELILVSDLARLLLSGPLVWERLFGAKRHRPVWPRKAAVFRSEPVPPRDFAEFWTSYLLLSMIYV